MQNSEIGVLPLGGSSQGGAVLEIEAKLGRLIDKGTNDRISIPVMTEAILNRNNPNVRTAFESSMTEYQHRALNAFLNKALVSTKQPKSLPPNAHAQKPARVPMDYKHTKEIDTFYELSQRGLLSLPNSLNVSTRTSHGNRMKVRVTHDQKTGKELAKIVKIRLADIDIYSPHNQVDWRISVNVEMNFEGDLGDLIEPERKQGGAGDRAKDRLTYHHQAYQIDLTQVSPFEVSVPWLLDDRHCLRVQGAANSQKEHELEIEISAEEVRRQGGLLQRGEANQYMDLISGFIDNVRTMVRQVPADTAPLLLAAAR